MSANTRDSASSNFFDPIWTTAESIFIVLSKEVIIPFATFCFAQGECFLGLETVVRSATSYPVPVPGRAVLRNSLLNLNRLILIT